MKKQFTAAALALSMLFAAPAMAVGKAAVTDISIMDARGKAISIAQLPKEEQEKVRQVLKAAKGIQENGVNQRVKVTVGCSYPPLKCTITIEF